MSNSAKRKLTAIVAMDVADYARHMQADEDSTLSALTEYRSVITDMADEHGGRLVSSAGDGFLLEFSSAINAVRYGSGVQDEIAGRNKKKKADKRLVFRAGIHMGDVMIDGDDLFGDSVNIAARLQEMADPGGICISSAIYDQVTRRLSLKFEDLGSRQVKNISQPVRIYRLNAKGGAGKLQRDDFSVAPAPRSPADPPAAEVSRRRRLTALILCLPPMGLLGLHRFYCGKVATGVLWAVSGGGLFFGMIYDLVLIITGEFRDKSGAKLLRWWET